LTFCLFGAVAGLEITVNTDFSGIIILLDDVFLVEELEFVLFLAGVLGLFGVLFFT
jgi:hypothetical protein